MSYLRVNMVNTESTEKRDVILDRINTKAGEMFPEIQMMLAIATGDTTAMSISIYEDEAAAGRAIAQRDHNLDSMGTKLEVAFEGELKAFYKKEPINVDS